MFLHLIVAAALLSHDSQGARAARSAVAFVMRVAAEAHAPQPATSSRFTFGPRALETIRDGQAMPALLRARAYTQLRQ